MELQVMILDDEYIILYGTKSLMVSLELKIVYLHQRL